MRRQWIGWLLMLCLAAAMSAGAATGRVIKVLPQFLDEKGRNSIAPSLYERDAYQVVLREQPKRRSGMCFAVHWKVRGAPAGPLTLRVELRGIAEGNLPKQRVLEAAVKPGGWFGRWTTLTLRGEEYKQLGQVTAWRATLWEGQRLLGQEQSFLW